MHVSFCVPMSNKHVPQFLIPPLLVSLQLVHVVKWFSFVKNPVLHSMHAPLSHEWHPTNRPQVLSGCKQLVEGRGFESSQPLEGLGVPGCYALLHTFHFSATCKMGAEEDPMAVCDEQARVYGVEGLRVVDCSLQPDAVRANLQFTVYMMAERISAQMRHNGSLEAALKENQAVLAAS